MTILAILGLLAFCYLMAGSAGFLMFWTIMRWPLVFILAVGAIANLVPSWLVVVFAILAAVPEEKIPDETWDWINLILYVGIVGGGLFLLGVFN